MTGHKFYFSVATMSCKNTLNEYEVGLAEDRDLPRILHIQESNSSTVVPAHKKAEMGFVTMRTSEELLRDIQARVGITVTRYNGDTVGYMIPMAMDQISTLELFKPFIAEFQNIPLFEYASIAECIADERVCMGGQVCIDPPHRGKGLTKLMAGHAIPRMVTCFDFVISEIDVTNSKSVQVHIRKLGFESMGFYEAGGKTWMVIAKDLRPYNCIAQGA